MGLCDGENIRDVTWKWRAPRQSVSELAQL